VRFRLKKEAGECVSRMRLWGRMCNFKYKIVEMSVAKTVNSNESAKRRESTSHESSEQNNST